MLPNPIKTPHPAPNLVPAHLLIGCFYFIHCAGQHHAELVIGKLEHIRQALLGGLTARTEDFLAVNGILHRLEFGGGQVGG